MCELMLYAEILVIALASITPIAEGIWMWRNKEDCWWLFIILGIVFLLWGLYLFSKY